MFKQCRDAYVRICFTQIPLCLSRFWHSWFMVQVWHSCFPRSSHGSNVARPCTANSMYYEAKRHDKLKTYRAKKRVRSQNCLNDKWTPLKPLCASRESLLTLESLQQLSRLRRNVCMKTGTDKTHRVWQETFLPLPHVKDIVYTVTPFAPVCIEHGATQKETKKRWYKTEDCQGQRSRVGRAQLWGQQHFGSLTS